MEYNSQKKKTDKQKSARKKGRNGEKSKQGLVHKGFNNIHKKLFELEERIKLLEGQIQLLVD